MTQKYSSVDLQDWLFEKASSVSAGTARKYIQYNDQRGVSSGAVGKLYFFKYDPKTKEKMLQYDKFPMAFVIEQYSNGFLGLNLHYVDIATRQAIIDRFLELRTNEYMDERTRMRLSYQVITSSSILNKLTGPCIKRYLYNHCRSQFIEIYPDEYDKAIELPVEEWVFKR